MSKKVKAEVGTVEMVTNPILDSEMGYNTEEGVAAIQNKEMKAAVIAFAKADAKLYIGMWDKAKAAARMKKDVRKEFGNDTRLAHFLGLSSKAVFNRLRRAGELAKEAMENGLSVTVVSELLPLENEKHGNQNLVEHFPHVAECMMTAKEARDYVKEFLVGIEDNKEESSEQVAADGVEEEESCVDTTEERWVAFPSVSYEVLDDLESGELDMLRTRLETIFRDYGITSDYLYFPGNF